MPSPIDKYTVRRSGFVLVVVPVGDKPRVVEVFDHAEISIPAGPSGYAIFLNRERAFTSMLIERMPPGAAEKLTKTLVYGLNRQLHGVPEPPKRAEGESWEDFEPRYAAFAAAMDESRERVEAWSHTVGAMLAEALSVLED